jgi:hypothetical protein
MSTCTFCENSGPFDDEGACLARCAGIRAKIRDRLDRGLLPYYSQREVRPLTVALPDVYVQCAACDVPIIGAATAIPAWLLKKRGKKTEIALHDVCHVIWYREAGKD